MTLSPEVIEMYKDGLFHPEKHDLPWKSLDQCFEVAEVATAKHILYKQYRDYIDRDVPKVVFYIIMDEKYSNLIEVAPDGNLGYKLKLTV